MSKSSTSPGVAVVGRPRTRPRRNNPESAIAGDAMASLHRGSCGYRPIARCGSGRFPTSKASMDQIVDALVVDVDGWMPLFVVLRDDCKLDEALQRDIIARIREACSPRHS